MFSFIRRNKFRSHQMLQVGDEKASVLVPAHLVGVPEYLEQHEHLFSNREVGDLASLAKKYRAHMSLQSWQETLISAQAAGTQLTASTTATTLLPSQAIITLPNGYFGYVGKAIRVTACLGLGNVAATPGTLLLDVRLGGAAIFSGGAMILSTTVHANLPCWVQILLTTRVDGSAANMIGQGFAMGQALSFTANGDLSTSNSIGSHLLPETAPAVGSNFNATNALALDFFGTFSLNNADTVQVQQYIVESLN